jgi:hypothetical protein
MFGVKVRFRRVNEQAWSKPYTYQSVIEVKPGADVLVPAGDYFSVGQVSECIPDYKFNPELNYKSILMDVSAATK